MEKKTYSVSPFTWILSGFMVLLAAFLVFCAIAVTPQVLTMENPFFMLLTFLALLAMIAFVVSIALLFLDVPTTRLELSDEGLIFYSTGYRIYTFGRILQDLAGHAFRVRFPVLFNSRSQQYVPPLQMSAGNEGFSDKL